MVGIAGVGGCFHILINTLTIHARIVMSVDGGVSCGGGRGVGVLVLVVVVLFVVLVAVLVVVVVVVLVVVWC